MDRPHRRIVAPAIVLALSIPLVGCGPGGSPSPSPSNGPSPIPASPTAGTAAFNLTVVPARFTGIIHSGSKVVLLASVDGSPADGPVAIEAAVAGGTASVEPAQLLPGGVAEVTVTGLACASDCEQGTTSVTIVAKRGGISRTETREMALTAEVDQLEQEARSHLAPFVDWLAANRPELGITRATVWESVPAPWVLIVEHHLFFSTDWELDISWHVMVPPSDWSQIFLRHRGTEIAPSLAFQIDSVSGKTTPHPIQVPEGVWR